ncbi:precorrin-2 dehydrogenase/sirohydrochlorin ferrochelatase family protein [Nitriliruptor alkaliphilus]|uniref:precorrin-2 dehydrogenase/sirohydrochlorin ferrochelatase family protein n=1 Tax=Nitriliruptor alkaliphilus TaxID=427918 RepID=UPI0006973884|nr:bifunctional precorrin-2 dehydrogenase/sirohydrochlorin ferrochelatase [Nitriliruptor alkaliphilus]
MAFSLSVTLEVTGRRAVVVGGGYEAVDRTQALLHGDAEVLVITPDPDPALVALADAGRLTLRRRGYRKGDLAGAFVAYVTREDPTDVEATWAEATRERVLLSTLDDVPHCHFATPSVVRRGDLAMTIATMGRAPALAKRLRRHLEDEFGPELGDLVDVLDDAKQGCLPRSVPFAEWAARWEVALTDLDGLLAALRDGRHAEVRAEVERCLRTPTDTLQSDEVPA